MPINVAIIYYHYPIATYYLVLKPQLSLISLQNTNSLDVHVLVDVIAECMGSEQSELANIGESAIRLVTETCKYILGM